MPSKRLSVVVTRRLPEAVETRMTELFDVSLRDSDESMSREEMIVALLGADVLVCTLADSIDAGVLGQA
jgi:glyoxylate reductase